MNFSEYEPAQSFLVQGNSAAFDALLAEQIVADPMTNALSVPRFTIDHARSVVEFNNEATSEKRTYLIYFSIFSPEAAQVLLKTLEEPASNTHYILMTPYPYLVPATVRSRTMLLASQQGTGEVLPHTSRAALLDYVKDEFGSDSDDDAATKRARAAELLDALEVHVSKTPAKARIIYEAKDMLYTANMPTKYVLDYAIGMTL